MPAYMLLDLSEAQVGLRSYELNTEQLEGMVVLARMGHGMWTCCLPYSHLEHQCIA